MGQVHRRTVPVVAGGRALPVFDKFTNRAREVMSRARHEAERLQHPYIGTEHLLLGLVEDGQGIAALVLKNLDVDLRRLRAAVERLRPHGRSDVRTGELPFTPRAKRLLETAQIEASHLGHDYIGTEHLLLGLLRHARGGGVQLLESLGINRVHVANEMLEVLGAGSSEGWDETDPMDLPIQSPWPILSCPPGPEAHDILDLALDHAARIGANEVEPLHLLHSLLRETCASVAAALGNLGLDPAAWRNRLERSRVPGEPLGPGELRLAPPTNDVLACASKHGQRRSPAGIGACELFLGLVDWGTQLFEWLLHGSVGVPVLRYELLDLAGADSLEVATQLLRQPPTMDHAMQTLSPPAREALDHAIAEAQRRGASEVGAEHLLLGLARPSSGGAAAILETMGAFPEDLRPRVEAVLGAPREPDELLCAG